MKYSFVVPICNDGALARDFTFEFQKAFRKRIGKDDLEQAVELIFVDDGSSNDSVKKLKKVRAEFAFVKVIGLSRNFGQHIALSCGYRYATGDYVGMLNVDQEDPPDQLCVLLDAIEEPDNDWDIVGGLYEKRDVPFFAALTSWAFNKTLAALTGYDSPTNASTARVMNRRFVDAYNALSERSRYIPGLEMWLGFKYGRVPVVHKPRKVGKSSYNFSRRMRMATESIISFSDFPLRLTVKFGFLVAAAGIVLVLAQVVDKLFFRAFLPGYLSTITIIVILGGVQIIITGIASLYIGRVLAEVQGRPLFIVREAHGVDAVAVPSRPAEVQPGRPS